VILALDGQTNACGMIAFYCNDQLSRVGYITYVAVSPESRGRGVGRKLL